MLDPLLTSERYCTHCKKWTKHEERELHALLAFDHAGIFTAADDMYGSPLRAHLVGTGATTDVLAACVGGDVEVHFWKQTQNAGIEIDSPNYVVPRQDRRIVRLGKEIGRRAEDAKRRDMTAALSEVLGLQVVIGAD